MNRQADLSPKVYTQIAQQWRDPKPQPPGCLASLAYLGPLMLQTKEKLFPDDTYFLTDFSKWLFSSQPCSHASFSLAMTFMKLWIFVGIGLSDSYFSLF